MDYGAVNDGSGDQTAKLQKAIDDDGNGGTRKSKGTTRYPAEVYLPGGIYTLGSTLTLTVGTIIVGDPQNPPVIKAASNFQGQFLVMGYDKNNGNPETSFMMLVKNVILDTTAVAPNTKITALQWGVAQGSGLTNLQIHMPTNSKGHTGIDIAAGSTIAVTDVVSRKLNSNLGLVLTSYRGLLAARPVLSIRTSKSTSRTSTSLTAALPSSRRVDGQFSSRVHFSSPAAQVST